MYQPLHVAQAKQQIPINLLALNAKLQPHGVSATLDGKCVGELTRSTAGNDPLQAEPAIKVEFDAPDAVLAPRDEVHHANVSRRVRNAIEAQYPDVKLAGKLHDAGAAYGMLPLKSDPRRSAGVWHYEGHPCDVAAFMSGLIAAL